MPAFTEERRFAPWSVLVTTEPAGIRDTATFPRQVHGSRILSATACVSGESEADGIFVSHPGVAAGVDTADCLPLVLLTPHAGAVLHVSRKTLVRGLLEHVPDVIAVSEITHAIIGPHICEQHFTFTWEGEEVKAFREKFPAAVEHSPLRLSLERAVRTYLDAWHVSASNVVNDGRCTFEDPRLVSYRRWLARGKNGSVTPGIATILRRVA